MGQNTNQRGPMSLPNTGNRPPVLGPTYNPQAGGGFNPVGYNGMPQVPQLWSPGAGGGNNGDQMGGGSATSQASTEAFNRFLQSFMSSGGMQSFMQPANPSQYNPYFSLINPNVGQQVPGQVPNPVQPGGGGGGGGFNVPNTPMMPPTTYNPNGPGWNSPLKPPGGIPGMSNTGFSPTFSQNMPLQDTGPMIDPQMQPLSASPGTGMIPFNPGTPPVIKPADGGTGGSGPNVNQYGMPTGGYTLGNVPGQYNSPTYKPFDLQNMLNNPEFQNMMKMGLGGQANLADAGSADVYGKFATDTQNLLQRKADRDVADLRARYGMGGGSNLGSAAALAEGNFRAENNAQIGTALGNINLQERGLNLTQRGQDLQNYLGSRGLDINQLGLLSNNAQFGSDLGMRNSQFENLFNQNNSQFGATFGQNAAIQNNNFGLQNQQQMNQYGIGVAGVGMQQQQLAQQQQQFMFEQMMRAYMAQAGWNTPQAENVVQPSWLSQAAGGVATGLDLWNKYKQATGK